MKTLLLTLTFTLCGQVLADTQSQIIEFHVDRSVVDIDNAFSRNNPYYKQRAGAFYEIKYVSPAAESLFKLADVGPEQMSGTLDALRAYVYEFLDAYVRADGTVTAAELAKCLARMDKRFNALFDTRLQRMRYREWRDDGANPLGFIMVLPGAAAQISSD